MLTLTVLDQQVHQQFNSLPATIRLVGGSVRQDDSEPAVARTIHIETQPEGELDLTLTLLPGDGEQSNRVELTNRGRSVALSHGPRIHRGRSTEISLPVSFAVGQTQYQLVDRNVAHEMDAGLTSLAKTLLPGEAEQRTSPGPETLAAWLETLSDLQQVAAGSQELFQLAARAVFNPGGLDGCLILRPAKHDWQVVASHVPYPDHGISYREDLVDRCWNTGETLYHDASVLDRWNTLDDLHTAVVCPVINADSQAEAIVYGFRSLNRRNARKGIRFLEAQFVQVVCDSLSAGMVRLESESQAARAGVLLEQAFAPRIARQLQSDRSVLQPTVKEVTVLFADLHRYSTIAEQIGPQQSFELLADVMDRFSNAITDLDGVVIDFYGDGISAFWNAPWDQSEHPLLACQAAHEIMRTLPELNSRWAEQLGQPLQVGIGIHTGIASVGNSGSRTRLKYGPRGTTVNLAARLEALNRETGTSILVSGQTVEHLAGGVPVRRLASQTLKGHQEPVDIYELLPNSRSGCKPESGIDIEVKQTDTCNVKPSLG